MKLDFLGLSHWSRPSFSFKKDRGRSEVRELPGPGLFSAPYQTPGVHRQPLLFKILDGDATDGIASSRMLNSFQKIVAHRATRLTEKEHRELARHVSRMRYLLILNTQDKSTRITSTKPKSRRRSSSGPYQKRRERRRVSYSKVHKGY